MTELRTEEFPDLEGDTANGPKDYVADCVIESDLELLLPFDYVPQESERIALYQELDSIERADQLEAFEERLRDRFGRIPDSAAELLRVPRLRSIARKLGIEKLVLKQGQMFTYFVSDDNKAYYQSAMFGRMLTYLQVNSKRVAIRQRNERRSFVFSNVPSVTTALDILTTILTLPSV